MPAKKTPLSDWAKETRAALDPKVSTLISQANFDLYNGPSGFGEDEDYPGFVSATKAIRAALHTALPSALYVDNDSGCWSDSEPTEEDGGQWFGYSRREMVSAIVGKELTEYVL